MSSVARCLDCEEFLCGICKAVHLKTKATRDHKVFTVEEMHSEKYHQELRAFQFTFCRQHKREPFEFYCITCKLSICVKCKVHIHGEHKSVPIKNISNVTKEKFGGFLEDLKKKRVEFQNALRVAKSEEKKNVDINEKTTEAIESRKKEVMEMIEQWSLSMCDNINNASKQNVEQLTITQSNFSSAIDSMSKVIAYIEPCLDQGSSAEIMDMSKQFTPKIQKLLKSEPKPLPVLCRPFLQNVRITEDTVQRMIGEVVFRAEKILEVTLQLEKGDSQETLSHISSTPDGDIVVGTWSSEEDKRHIYVYSCNGVKKHTFTVPGLQGLAVLPDGCIAATVWPRAKQEVCLYELNGRLLESFHCPQPGTIAVDSNGNLFVAIKNVKIRTFTTKGKETHQFD